MKIAVASTGSIVAGHFGHCESFNIYESADGALTSAQNIPNPGHKPGFLPNFLGDMGVSVVIAGGMGGSAAELFRARDIEVILGAEGGAQDAAERYLRGELKSTGSVCHEHEHAGECGGHHA